MIDDKLSMITKHKLNELYMTYKITQLITSSYNKNHMIRSKRRFEKKKKILIDNYICTKLSVR